MPIMRPIDHKLVNAVRRAYTSEAISLIEAGANPNAELKGYDGTSNVLNEAVGLDDIQMVAALLKAGADPNKSYSLNYAKYKMTPIDDCLRFPDRANTEAKIRLLHQYGANINYIQLKPEAYSPLTDCIRQNNVRLTALFLELGAQLDLGKSKFSNAMHRASLCTSPEIKALVNAAQLTQLAVNSMSSIEHGADALTAGKSSFRIRI